VRVMQIVRKICRPCSKKIHAFRIRAFLFAVEALLKGNRLSATCLGRFATGPIYPKYNIKRIDRLLSNPRLQSEVPQFYRAIANRLLGKTSRPVVILDWTKPVNGFYALVASAAFTGRALTIYSEVHPEHLYNNSNVNKRFLRHLSNVLPSGCKPVLVIDAGFKGPVYREIIRLGWDFVARARKPNTVRKINTQAWISINILYARATSVLTDLGVWDVAKYLPVRCRLVLIKKVPLQVRKRNKKPRSGTQKGCISASIDPWLLATTLMDCSADQVVALYSTRMQIEEIFRDAKNHRFGWSFRDARCHQAKRIEVLLLVATVAMLSLIMVGLQAQCAGVHRYHQANTVTNRRVLSFFFLGMRIVANEKYAWLASFTFVNALSKIHDEINKHSICE
jgi:hypothetical protein